VADIIDTAGLTAPASPDPRRLVLAEARRVLRDPQSSDAEVEDALEALVELGKE